MEVELNFDRISSIAVEDTRAPYLRMSANELWRDMPVLVFIVANPSCIFCRVFPFDIQEEARLLSAYRETITEIFKVKIVAVTYQLNGLAEFSQIFKGSVLFDKEKAFYKEARYPAL
jgi:thioredoxin-related protein